VKTLPTLDARAFAQSGYKFTSQMSTQDRLGVLGGGQLGRMMAQAASRLGVSLTVLDPGGLASPAGMVAGQAITGSFTDAAKVRELAERCDVLTVEIEHVDAAVLAEIEAEGKVRVHPAPSTIAVLQDKLKQKRHLQEQPGVQMGDFCDVPDAAALLAAGESWGYPIMLKARTLAYDGRGNLPVKAAKDVPAAFAELSRGGAMKLYAERWCSFTVELAVMVARSSDGTTATYPVAETEQVDSQCTTVIVPARVSVEMAKQAAAVATTAVASLAGGGIFGVELFAMPDGTVLLNEIAPRPHNSGHYTMDAALTDQHEQHLRAVLGLPLGGTALKVPAVGMLNVIGSADGELATTLRPVARALSMPRASVHWYGKSPPKPRRKMGHLNVVAESAAAAAAALLSLQGEGAAPPAAPRVGVIMGSDSDLSCMRAAAEVLEDFGVAFELTIVSAHRTPDRLVEYAKEAEQRGLLCIIAGAGGAAHLPGMVAAMTPLPVIGVPVKSSALSGNDSLLSIVQMPRGIPVATVAIGNAANAGLLAVRMLGMGDATLRAAMSSFMAKQEAEVLAKADKLEKIGFRAYLGE